MCGRCGNTSTDDYCDDCIKTFDTNELYIICILQIRNILEKGDSNGS
jgi:hypothetical protein